MNGGIVARIAADEIMPRFRAVMMAGTEGRSRYAAGLPAISTGPVR
jgi:hypothetical protein